MEPASFPSPAIARSKTYDRIEKLAAASTSVFLLVVWMASISSGFRREQLLIATLTALAYAGVYLLLILTGRLDLLFAAVAALPAGLLPYFAMLYYFHAWGWLSEAAARESVKGIGMGCVLGLLLWVPYAAAVDTAAKRLFRSRIERERRGNRRDVSG